MKNKQSNGGRWGITLTLGVLLILGGVLAVATSVLTTVVSAIYIGALLAVVGVLEIVTAFRVPRGGPRWQLLLAGLLALVVGVLFLWHPLAGAASLTLLIAGYMFASGLFRGVSAAAERYSRWGWDLAYGIVAVLLGVYLVASWPISSLWVLGTLVGAEIIARGVALVAGAWVLRDIEHGNRRPRAA